jgi:hypothetical protein
MMYLHHVHDFVQSFDSLLLINAILIFGISLLVDVVILIVWFATGTLDETVKEIKARLI